MQQSMGLLRNNLVCIAENSDFRLTDKGIAECENRRRTSILNAFRTQPTVIAYSILVDF